MKAKKVAYTPSKYDVVFNGKFATLLNAHLLVSQKAEENLELIKSLHVERLTIQAIMEKTNPVKDKARLKALNAEFMDNQRALQKAWNFPQNDNFIRFWEVPHCKCPRMDNEENYPHGYYSVDMGCPVHGSDE